MSKGSKIAGVVIVLSIFCSAGRCWADTAGVQLANGENLHFVLADPNELQPGGTFTVNVVADVNTWGFMLNVKSNNHSVTPGEVNSQLSMLSFDGRQKDGNEPNDLVIYFVFGISMERVPAGEVLYSFTVQDTNEPNAVWTFDSMAVNDGNGPLRRTMLNADYITMSTYTVNVSEGTAFESESLMGGGVITDTNMVASPLDQTETEITQDTPANTLSNTIILPRYNCQVSSLSCPANSANSYRMEEFEYSSTSEMSLCMETLDGSGYVELGEITSSQILDTEVIYYVPYPPLLIHGINGAAIDVVIPSGTVIVFAEDWQYGIVVYDGANVYFGSPAPQVNEPEAILPPGDSGNPVPPVELLGESGYPFFNSFCGIFIDRTAGTRSRLDNIYLNGFYYGIQVDQQLKDPISNIHTFGCYNGILSFGANRIVNSTVNYYGMWSSEWPYDGYAYEFMSQSLDASIFFGGADFSIFNCLANDGDYGFTANGLEEPYEMPNFYSWDCVAANCYTGFNCINGMLGISVICPGLYNNIENQNFPELPFTDPVYESSDPFVFVSGDYRIFLNPNSLFVNSGSGISPFPGWTTSADGAADKGIGDIWPHYQTRKIDKFTEADLNADYTINMLDISIFAAQWLATGTNSADLNGDGNVNSLDFAILANLWQINDISLQFINPESGQTIGSDAIRGYVGIDIKDISLFPQIYAISVYLDNTPIGTLSYDLDQVEQWIDMESQSFLNGWHTLRFATVDIYGNVINHRPINIKFSNSLYLSDVNEHFIAGQNYKISGFHDGSNPVTVTVSNLDNQTIWTNNYSGSYINVSVPAATFNSQVFANMTIASSPGRTINLVKKFKQAECPSGVKMVIVLPNSDIYKRRLPAIYECVRACDQRNVSWVVLYYYDVTEENLTFLFTKSSVKYIYWCGHAGNNVGGVPRTHTECWRYVNSGPWSFGSSGAYIKNYVFSYINPEYPLPSNWDDVGFDLTSLGMSEQNNKKIVFVDGCLSSTASDMAQAYGVYSLEGWGSLDQIYIGWRCSVKVGGGLSDLFLGSNEGIRWFWEKLGTSEGNIMSAFNYTLSAPELTVRYLWGPNCEMNLSDLDGDDNIFVQGLGFNNLNQIKLE